MAENKNIVVRAYAPKEIREMYGLSGKQWRRWLDDTSQENRIAIGEPVGGLYTPKQVRAIFNAFDPPESNYSESPEPSE